MSFHLPSTVMSLLPYLDEALVNCNLIKTFSKTPKMKKMLLLSSFLYLGKLMGGGYTQGNPPSYSPYPTAPGYNEVYSTTTENITLQMMPQPCGWNVPTCNGPTYANTNPMGAAAYQNPSTMYGPAYANTNPMGAAAYQNPSTMYGPAYANPNPVGAAVYANPLLQNISGRDRSIAAPLLAGFLLGSCCRGPRCCCIPCCCCDASSCSSSISISSCGSC